MMNTLRRGVVVMALGVLAGAMSQAAPSAPAAGRDEVGTTPQVEVSARYVRVTGALPEAKGALGFLADEAGSKAGTVVLTKAQAEAAVAKLVEWTKREAGSTPRVTVLAGNPARMGIGIPHLEKGSEAMPIEISGQRAKMNEVVTVELGVFPQVMANKMMKIELEIQVTTFERFEEYTKPIEVKDGTRTKWVKVPEGFYQPIYSTQSIKAEVRISEGEAVVLRADRKATTVMKADGSKLETVAVADAGESLLVFLTAKIVPVRQ